MALVPRFAPTRPPVHWTGVLSATRHGAVCPQQLPDTANTTRALRTMSRRRLSYLRSVKRSLGQQAEDCLNLNIYLPHHQGQDAAQPGQGRGQLIILCNYFVLLLHKLPKIKVARLEACSGRVDIRYVSFADISRKTQSQFY